jgi:hypothetical protein
LSALDDLHPRAAVGQGARGREADDAGPDDDDDVLV